MCVCLSYVAMCFTGYRESSLECLLVDDILFEDDRECDGCEWPNQGRLQLWSQGKDGGRVYYIHILRVVTDCY